MARYVYEGPGPQEDGEGGTVRPGDVREFDAEPAWGPWRELPAGDPAQPPAPEVALPAPPPPPPPVSGEPPLAATGTDGM